MSAEIQFNPSALPNLTGAPTSRLVDLANAAPRRCIAALRLLVSVLLIAHMPGEFGPIRALLIGALVAYSLSAFAPDVTPNTPLPCGPLAVALDVVLCAWLVAVTGNLSSHLLPVLYLPLLEAAAILSFGAALVCALIAGGLLALLGTWPQVGRIMESALFQPVMDFEITAVLLVSALSSCRLLIRKSPETPSPDADICKLRSIEEKLDYISQHDSLTELANRALFCDILTETLGRCGRNQHLAGLLLVDLDGFKNINSECGHQIGDAVLKVLGERLSGCIRKTDTVARMGSDEFGVLLVDMAEAQNSAAVAAKIQKEISQPIVLDEREFIVTSCVGISVYPSDGPDAAAMMRSAETALRQAREHGAGSVKLHAPTIGGKPMERVSLEKDFRRALEREELVLHYQPQVNLTTRQVVSMEALVRWRHPTLGLLGPGKFIPLAEETGLIIPMTDWVLRTACKQNRAWQEAGLPPFHVAVNLSARHFQRKNVVPAVVDALKSTGLHPEWIELEITEGVAMYDPEYAAMVLRRLKEMGIQIAIDDFGTGFSSLSYLKKFPFDTIKIDQSFVRDIVAEPENAAIVASVISLAQNLGRKVVAEGVETEKQLLFLRMRGCHQMQGYLFSKPLPAEQMTKLLLAQQPVMQTFRAPEHEESLIETIARYSYSIPPAAVH